MQHLVCLADGSIMVHDQSLACIPCCYRRGLIVLFLYTKDVLCVALEFFYAVADNDTLPPFPFVSLPYELVR